MQGEGKKEERSMGQGERKKARRKGRMQKETGSMVQAEREKETRRKGNHTPCKSAHLLFKLPFILFIVK